MYIMYIQKIRDKKSIWVCYLSYYTPIEWQCKCDYGINNDERISESMVQIYTINVLNYGKKNTKFKVYNVMGGAGVSSTSHPHSLYAIAL